MSGQGYCYLCKNRCPLDNPKCENGRSVLEGNLKRQADKAAQVCSICDKNCPLDNLECSLGRTIHEIKDRDRTIML